MGKAKGTKERKVNEKRGRRGSLRNILPPFFKANFRRRRKKPLQSESRSPFENSLFSDVITTGPQLRKLRQKEHQIK